MPICVHNPSDPAGNRSRLHWEEAGETMEKRKKTAQPQLRRFNRVKLYLLFYCTMLGRLWPPFSLNFFVSSSRR